MKALNNLNLEKEINDKHFRGEIKDKIKTKVVEDIAPKDPKRRPKFVSHEVIDINNIICLVEG